MALCFAAALLVRSVRADTLTLRSNAEINGRVEYEDDAFTITAQYRDGKRHIAFDRKEVLTVEVNPRDFNSGEPPKEISVTEARSGATKDASGSAAAHSGSSSGGAAPAKGGGGSSGRSMSDAGDADRATTDVVWLRDQTKVAGRLVSLKEGRLTIKCRDGIKEVNLQHVATVLVAPE